MRFFLPQRSRLKRDFEVHYWMGGPHFPPSYWMGGPHFLPPHFRPGWVAPTSAHFRPHFRLNDACVGEHTGLAA